jgi:phosphatidate cytidylyltransferase
VRAARAAAPAQTQPTRLRRALGAQRVVNGTLVAALGITSIFLPPVFVLLIVAITALGICELAQLSRRSGARIVLPAALAGAVLYLVLAYFQLLPHYEPLLLAAIVLASAAGALAYGKGRFAVALGLSVFAAVYLGKLLSYFVLLRSSPNGLALTLWVVVIVALTDIVAMLVGQRFGRTPLAPHVSPAKTWEGAFGAFAAATGLGAVLATTAYIGAPLFSGALCAGSICIAAQAGDLIESALKRSAHVKDSGRLIGGHGGILDRFDSYVTAGVVAYAVVRATGLA